MLRLFNCNLKCYCKFQAVVVAQLVERLLPTPEIGGSNPNIGKTLSTNCTFKKKRRKYRKRGWEWPIFKKKFQTVILAITNFCQPFISPVLQFVILYCYEILSQAIPNV